MVRNLKVDKNKVKVKCSPKELKVKRVEEFA